MRLGLESYRTVTVSFHGCFSGEIQTRPSARRKPRANPFPVPLTLAPSPTHGPATHDTRRDDLAGGPAGVLEVAVRELRREVGGG